MTVMHVVVDRSRAKGVACVVGCALFIVASLAIVAQGSAISLVVGAVGLLTFAGFGIGWIALLLRSGPGLVVDDDGFDDRSSAAAVGRVPWADVTSLSRRSIGGTALLVVKVREPEAYLTRLGLLARLAASANLRWLGSPVVVASVPLKTDFAGLSRLLSEGFERYHLRGPET